MESEICRSRSESGNGSSEAQETEQDSDGIWSTASEYKSDSESVVSESVSHGLLTVRDKTATKQEMEPSGIQQLISAAESLAFERRQSLSGIESLANASIYSVSTAQTKMGSHRERNSHRSFAMVQQPSTENDDSGYYGKTKTPGTEEHTPEYNRNSSLIKNHSLGVQFLSESEINQNITHLPPASEGILNIASSKEPNLMPQDTQSGQHPYTRLDQFNIKYESPPKLYTRPTFPALPHLDLGKNEASSSHQGRVTGQISTQNIMNQPIHQDIENVPNNGFNQRERLTFTKDVKEVCNSSIKGNNNEHLEDTSPKKFGVSVLPGSSSQWQSLGSKEVSSLVHDECGNLHRLALDSTSNLGRVIRLLRQVMTLQFGTDTPKVADSVHKELEEYEQQHHSLQSQLSPVLANLQTTFGQVQGLESTLFELQKQNNLIEKISSNILCQVEETLSACGLHHMIAVTSPRRRSIARTLEDAESALTLILGELSRKMSQCRNLGNELQCQDQEREGLKKQLLQSDSMLLSVKRELDRNNKWANNEISSLKQCLSQAETSIAEIRSEKEQLSDSYKKQSNEDKKMIKKIQKQLLDIQHSADSKILHMENCFQEMAKERLHFEESIHELKNRLSVQDQQMNLLNEEHSLLVAGLRSTIKHQQAEGEKTRSQLEQALADKQNTSHRLEDLSNELMKEQEAHEKLQDEASSLNDKIRDMQQNFKECEMSLHSKVDSLSSVRCDLERKLRAKDLAILQLEMELKLDAQRINALTEDNNNLLQKTQNLQERVWEVTRWRRRHGSGNGSVKSCEDQQSPFGFSSSKNSENGGSTLSLAVGATNEGYSVSQKIKSLQKDVNDGQSREEKLHRMMTEKDEAIKNLQNTLTAGMTAKNKELEMLRKKLPELEDQMGSLLAAVEVNEAMGQVTTQVGRHLQERQEHLDNLNRSSNILQDEYAAMAIENQKLKSELSATKSFSADYSGEMLDSARKAKEEARQERLNAARLEERCHKLQAQLQCSSSLLEQERRERAMRDMVHQIKHNDFGAVLESTASSSLGSTEVERNSFSYD